jgi:transcription factor-like protein
MLLVFEANIKKSLFYFNRGDEGLAWRLNGVAARMCFELGLHQQETFESGLQNNMDRYRACVLFWSIYVLDRRWSFSTGLPFSIQDHELDPALLKPVSIA